MQESPEQSLIDAAVELAIARFARRCKEHVRLYDDPLSVINDVHHAMRLEMGFTEKPKAATWAHQHGTRPIGRNGREK